jgi:antitoxin VapB
MKKPKPAGKGRALFIRNPAAHHLAEQLSKRLGVTLSDAVISALDDKLRKTARPLDRARIDAVTDRLAALPVLDARCPEEILGYDKFGIPH